MTHSEQSETKCGNDDRLRVRYWEETCDRITDIAHGVLENYATEAPLLEPGRDAGHGPELVAGCKMAHAEVQEPADVGNVESPLLSVSRRTSSRVSTTMWPSRYLVAGLSSVRNDPGWATTGIRNSLARVANHVRARAPVSAAINSASFDECATVVCRAEAQATGCSESTTSRPATVRRVSASAAQSAEEVEWATGRVPRPLTGPAVEISVDGLECRHMAW